VVQSVPVADRQQDRRFGTLLAAIAAIGLVIRTVYVVAVARHQALIGDSETYELLARTVSDAQGYVRPRELAAGTIIPTAEFPPAYPLILSALNLLGFQATTWHRLFGALLGCITIVLIGQLGRAMGGTRAGLIAAGVAAVYPQLIVFDGSIGSEGLAALLVVAIVLASFRAERVTHFLAVGLLGGTAMLVRAELVLVLAAVLIPVAWRHWARRYSLAVLAVGVGAIVGPWVLRNQVSLGHPVVFTNNSGTLIAGANCAGVYSGPQIGLWRLDCVPAPTGSDETVWSSEQREVGVDYARDNLGRLPVVGAVRLLRTFGLYDVPDQVQFESLESRPVGWLQLGWVVYIVVAGIAVASGVHRLRRKAPLRVLVVPIVLVGLVSIAGYGNQRFRLPAEPMIIVLAALGIDAALNHRQARNSATTTERRLLPSSSPAAHGSDRNGG
jgi:Dolichyl-phosphate-mannose-protein mannosyltransferase